MCSALGQNYNCYQKSRRVMSPMTSERGGEWWPSMDWFNGNWPENVLRNSNPTLSGGGVSGERHSAQSKEWRSIKHVWSAKAICVMIMYSAWIKPISEHWQDSNDHSFASHTQWPDRWTNGWCHRKDQSFIGHQYCSVGTNRRWHYGQTPVRQEFVTERWNKVIHAVNLWAL